MTALVAFGALVAGGLIRLVVQIHREMHREVGSCERGPTPKEDQR